MHLVIYQDESGNNGAHVFQDFFLKTANYSKNSLVGAREREFGVCRLKTSMLKNCRQAREPPLKVSADENLVYYTGSQSGLKKRMPKKTGEGIEYYTQATSNKGYEGYKDEIRDDPIDGKEGNIIRPADPVCGGYILN